MEGRPTRGRGGCWRRGGGGGSEGGSSEHRGRGRGGRGRGKRDHYRGRGGAAASGFHHRHSFDGNIWKQPSRGQDEGNNLEEEEEEEEVFTRRKLESNWARYEESEKETQHDDDTPAQRGADFHVLLESAGDCFTQFRFSEEKEWEMDSLAASQFSAVFVDLPTLVQSLQELPLHQRLNLEAELVQVSTPVELPVLTAMPKPTLGSAGMTLRPPALAPTGPGASLGPSWSAPPGSGAAPQGSASTDTPLATPLAEDVDEELDQLLGLQGPASEPTGISPCTAREEEDEMVRDKRTQEGEEPVPEGEGPVLEEASAPPTAEPVKPDLTEEDLEDWLDSMIS